MSTKEQGRVHCTYWLETFVRWHGGGGSHIAMASGSSEGRQFLQSLAVKGAGVGRWVGEGVSLVH